MAPPVHFSKTYSAFGVAVTVATSPDSYCPLVGETVPPSVGLAVAVRVNNTGSSTSLLHENRITIHKKEKSFLIIKLVI